MHASGPTLALWIMQTRLRMVAYTFIVLSLAILWYYRMESCTSYALSWLGFLPMQFVMSVLLLIWTFIQHPIKPTKDFVLSVSKNIVIVCKCAVVLSPTGRITSDLWRNMSPEFNHGQDFLVLWLILVVLYILYGIICERWECLKVWLAPVKYCANLLSLWFFALIIHTSWPLDSGADLAARIFLVWGWPGNEEKENGKTYV